MNETSFSMNLLEALALGWPRVKALLRCLSIVLIASSCSVTRCEISAKKASQFASISGASVEVGEIYRVQGLYRGAFEVSRLLPVSESEIQTLDQVHREEPLDYCVRVAPACSPMLGRLTKAEGSHAQSYDYFGWVDALVRYDGVVEGSGCPMGEILIVRLVSGKPVL